ncbi:F510_1955 family glycosylhydrolase [Arthrobacter sp.]|uniref:F510_1955 family glycosylhydrolase n=1 Tax=Arthrobacter sp. TaxID=1667 RepID=UPI003A8E277F
MPFPLPKSSTSHRRTGLAAILAFLAVLLSSCATPPAMDDSTPVAAPGDYPTSHIHAMAVDGTTGQILLATHEGLYDVSTKPATKIGPDIDLMGFTIGAGGTMYASGHPGPGVDLPDPVGLIESTDGGRTWTALSRTGQSDFHALAATHEAIIGFDGQLLVNEGGSSWTPAVDQIPAFHLSATPDGHVVLATTEDGLNRSVDHGKTWTRVPGAPLLMLSAVSGANAAGIAPDGTVYSSADAGFTWRKQGSTTDEVDAISLTTSGGKTQLWIASTTGVRVSSDMGATFTAFEPGTDRQ